MDGKPGFKNSGRDTVDSSCLRPAAQWKGTVTAMSDMIEYVLDNVKERGFEAAMRRFSGETILIYGAGGFGVEMLFHLRRLGLSVSAFLDRRAEDLSYIEGIPVFTAEQAPFDRNGCVVLFSIVMGLEERRNVLCRLRDLGYGHVIEAQSLRCLLVQPDDRGEGSLLDYYQSRSDMIRQAEKLFEHDERSLQVYRSVLFSHASRDYSDCTKLESPLSQQYFPQDVPLKKGYQRFVDCGGYIGDTAVSALEQAGTIEAYAAFEPDSGNYSRMSAQLKKLQKIGARCLFPCAVSEHTGICGFSQGTGSGALSAEGNGMVQTVTLDQAIPDFRPTFIKMDIEGAEPSALRGARALITQNRPDLAICVYHAVNHLWDIPLLLDSWDLGYHFFLRSHNACTMETVLYAAVDS